MRAAPFLMLGALAVTLAACASGQRTPGPPRAVINRALANAPGAAQPSTIVAVEIAFARAARERGQWTAFREFAAPGALLHGKNGPFAIEPWLATQTDPPVAVQWQTRAVAISCDGAVAMTQGRLTTPEGKVGNFVTVWERQGNGEYRYVFDAGGLDVPQPPPRPPVEDGNIVVTAIDSVKGMVASCPRGGAAIPPPPPIPLGEDGKADARLSRDGTLRWRWEHRDDGTRYATADYFYEGRWLTAFEQSLAPGSE
ncbi:hypothetical protein [Porphyrobacter sp. AAP60]|uniref:hypothetical protein n=1 Tax=Porphyrobacter sp. AAP60 TaxID=1523423 RepID=UPI0006B9E593|nr:hypothetical protein [Porphyrobacter sp. AAP60]KPF63971.1 hypothetical protein IP79_09270 [Porphyrobacter sp. AAP60]